jgi:hypothetical protein
MRNINKNKDGKGRFLQGERTTTCWGTKQSLKKLSKVKKRIAKVWFIALYGTETWSERKENILRIIEAIEKSIWRKMEKIRWTEYITKRKYTKSRRKEDNVVNYGEKKENLNRTRNPRGAIDEEDERG